MRISLVLLLISLLPAMQMHASAAENAGKGKIESLKKFSENMAGISVKGKWGFINEDGKIIVEALYHEVGHFKKGYAAVKLVNKWGVIDKKGRYVINPSYDDMGLFAEDLIAVKVNGKWGYIDIRDRMVIPPQFSEALPFSHELAAVSIDSNWGFIDKKGRYTINPRFNGAGSFSNGLAPVQVGSQWGFMDKKGNLAIKPQFQKALGFSDGLAAVQDDTLWGFIDKSGRFQINPGYENSSTFAEGLAAVQKDGKWGYINRDGDLAIPLQYQEAGDFSDDIARVVSNGTVTYITPAGKDAGVGATASAAVTAAAPVMAAAATPLVSAQAASKALQAAPAAAIPLKSAVPQPLKDSGSFTVTPLASMSGSSNGSVSGSISPDSPQTVNANGTISFNIKPVAGTSVTTPLGGTCTGTITGNPADSVNGITFTTDPVTYDCTVEVPSFPPLTVQAWQNTVIPKHRAIISFLDTSGNINTFRGQGGDLQLSDSGIDFSGTYGTNVLTTTSSDLGISSSSSRIFSMAQTPGVVPQTVNLPAGQEFMGSTTFTQVPTGMLCSSYLITGDKNGIGTSLWIELTGQSETNGNIQRYGRVELKGVPAPVYQYKFNADGSHVLAPPTDLNVAHDMVTWDWNGDGYSDYMISYIHNPGGNNNWEKNMRVALVFVDGKSLYNASSSGSLDPGKQIFIWTNIDNIYTTGGDMVGGLTDVQPSNSVRLAIGDMDGDKKPEVALYYTKVQGPTGLAHNNAMKILRLVDAGTKNVYSDTSKKPDFNWVISTDSDDCKNDKNCSSMYQQVGESYLQYDSAVIAMGDLDGDGKDELAVLHGNTSALYQPSRTYLDVYKMNSDKKSLSQPIAGVKVGETAKMPSGKSSTPALEASIADLDGDGIGELVWTGLDKSNQDQLWIEIHKWPIVAATPGDPTATPPVAATPQTVNLSGTGTQSAYALKSQTGLSSWTLDTTYVRYSMDTGRFVYPDASKTLRKQIGLVTTMPGSKIRWGIFKWDWNSAKMSGTLTSLGNGTLANAPKTGNLVPSIIATDLDRDSMVLGQPTLITVTDSYSPFFIIQSPPRHFDLLSQVLVPQKDQNGNPIMAPQMMDAFSEFSGYSSIVTQGSEQAHMSSTTKSTAGEWGASIGVEIGKENPQYIPPPTFAAGLSYTGNYNSDKTTSTGTTMSAETEATAETDDQLYYWVNDLDIWLYPVLYPASQALTTNPDGTISRNYVRYVVPRVSGTAFSATNGKDVEWYEPWHNNLNLFSYPRLLNDIKDYPQGAASKPADSWWSSRNGTVFRQGNQLIGNDNATTFNFSISDKSQTEALKSTQHTIAPYVSFDPQHTGHIIKKDFSFPIDLSGSGSWGTQTATSNDNSSLSGIVMNWPGGTEYSSRSGLKTSDQKFQVNGSIYTSDTGTFSLGYAVSQLKSADSKIWGTSSPYRTMADPALNLPNYFDNSDGIWSVNDAARESGRIRGLQLSGDTVFTMESVRGQALPTGSPVTGSLRVYNYSFVPTGRISVSFKFQPISMTTFEAPDITKATIDLGTKTITTIPGREQDASSNNWYDLALSYTAPSQAGLGYLHVILASNDPITKDNSGNPKGGNLNINNDSGHILVGFYDPKTTGTSTVKSGAVKSSTVKGVPGSKSLKVVAGSMKVLPVKPDRKLGAAASVLEAGQKSLVEAQIRFDDTKGAKSSGILHVNVYLRNSKGIVAHRTVPLLINGRTHTVRIPYTAPKSGQSVPLQILVSSPYLPAAADSKPQGRIAKTLLTVSRP